jgi:hypothetical protein
MLDIEFDIVTREVVLSAPLGSASMDILTTPNPSVQNGGILLYGRCLNCVYPIFGIGIEDSINSNTSQAAFELNRWQQQCKIDGATFAKWAAKTNGANIEIAQKISYE